MDKAMVADSVETNGAEVIAALKAEAESINGTTADVTSM